MTSDCVHERTKFEKKVNKQQYNRYRNWKEMKAIYHIYVISGLNAKNCIE